MCPTKKITKGGKWIGKILVTKERMTAVKQISRLLTTKRAKRKANTLHESLQVIKQERNQVNVKKAS